MDIGNILNTRGGAAAAAEARRQQQLLQVNTPVSNLSDSDVGTPDREPTSSRIQRLHHPAQYPATFPSALPPDHTLQGRSSFGSDRSPERAYAPGDDAEVSTRSGDQGSRPFACSHCGKGFARRSDLARHERIHSGIRPHLCEYPGCRKEFIQRSALTVHTRVHTGEKPHICERCSKPFSDSSSLARHRRIHSGKRPYKCPFANCQKTFTRRTTLTRHQNHHTGTIEEAAAETNARLSTTGPRLARGPEAVSCEAVSSHPTPSPSQRPLSMSPGHELPPVVGLHRRTSDQSYGQPNGSFLPQLRHEFQQQRHLHSPRSSPGLPSPSLTGSLHSFPHRPSLTSHPAGYGPPQPLEPPANADHRSTGSAAGSPHLTPVGWGSPSTNNLPSPTAMDGYPYSESHYGGASLCYPGGNLRRPQSTEPDQYETRPRSQQQSSLTNYHLSCSQAPPSHRHPHPQLHTGHHLPTSMGVGHHWTSIPNLGMSQLSSMH